MVGTWSELLILYCRFIAYKLPKNAMGVDASNGATFLYMDTNNQTFQLSQTSLFNRNQAIGYTLNQIYSTPIGSQVGWICSKTQTNQNKQNQKQTNKQ